MNKQNIVLDGLSRRARTVLCDAAGSPINVETIDSETIRRLTRRYLLATPTCGPIIADEIVRWAEGHGITIPEA